MHDQYSRSFIRTKCDKYENKHRNMYLLRRRDCFQDWSGWDRLWLDISVDSEGWLVLVSVSPLLSPIHWWWVKGNLSAANQLNLIHHHCQHGHWKQMLVCAFALKRLQLLLYTYTYTIHILLFFCFKNSGNDLRQIWMKFSLHFPGECGTTPSLL